MTEKQWADEAEARKATLLSKMGGEESFRRGFDQRSHFPEKAAANALSAGLSYWEQGVAAVRTAGGDDELAKLWEERFLKKWVAYQQAGARCANWFITGPANFPVERNRKRQETEQRRYEEMALHVAGAAEWTRKRQRSAAKAAASAAIKASGETFKEREVAGVRLIQNTALDRVQLVFDGKPEPDIIAELKSRAFRWSPREGAWQRQLTRNGMWAAEAVLKRVEAEAS